MEELVSVSNQERPENLAWKVQAHLQWRQYVFDPLANYENWLLVEMGTEYKFTHLFL